MKKITSLIIATVVIMVMGVTTACSGNGTQTVDATTAAQDEVVAETEVETTDEVTTSTEETTKEASEATLEDGVYLAGFNTDSTMFHVNEANDGKGILTVENGNMVIHVSLPSKNTLNLYPGLAEDAEKDEAGLLQPTIDSVTYPDGTTEEVHGFDIPVPAIGEEFDCALIGTKGKWYDHKVSVTDPEPYTEEVEDEGVEAAAGIAIAELALEDGTYQVGVTLEGGTGRSTVDSPTNITVNGDTCIATITWSSPNYDYMIVDGEKILPINTEGNSVFEFPINTFDAPIEVIADTVAMSQPHEIEYELTFDSGSITPAE